MDARKGVERLDQVLSQWEDTCYINRIGAQVSINLGRQPKCSLTGPLIHAYEFRKYILKYKGGVFDFPRFIGDGTFCDCVGATSITPLAILAWNHHSRRIFNLPTDMQTLLDATLLNKIKWEEVKFPFDSFLLKLDDPLISDNGLKYDSILVAKVDSLYGSSTKKEGPFFELRLLPENFDNYKKIGKGTRKRIDSLVHNGFYGDIMEFLKSRPLGEKFRTPAVHIFPEMLKGKTITKSLPRLGELMGDPDMVKDSAVDSAIHIVLNFCLYLENFSSNVLNRVNDLRNNSKKKKSGKSFDSKAVMNEAEIFIVTCQFKMTKNEIADIVKEIKESKLKHEKSPHWRRAHWQRKPYCGHLPLSIAPKNWISCKLINAHLLPSESLPLGSRAVLT